MQDFNMVIDGKSIQSKKWFEVINPATGKAFARCPEGDASHVKDAIRAARAAFPGWSQTPLEKRKESILAISQALKANMPELMELVTKETGKPLNGLNGIGAGMEVGGAMAWADHTASLDIPVEVLQDDDDVLATLHRKPLGVVGSITPWNWPLMIAVWHSMPALLTGNTVVMKPSPMTPLSTTRLAELASEILPKGVFNVVTGLDDVGAALSQSEDIDKIIFTGSAATGKNIMRAASANLTRLTLELGGNDAGIVLPDIDVQAMAPKIFTACFHNNGQTCACLKRLYVHESIHDELAAALSEIAKSVKVGDGLEQDTELGPIQNEMQYKKILDLAKSAKADGGNFLAGGEQIRGDGYFFQPTIVTNLSDGSRLVDEEPFGPILPIIKYSDIHEVIDRANNNPCGLGGSVWSSDLKQAKELASKLECGTIWINDHGSIQPNMPFGGVKQSGFGTEFGQHGLEEFCSIQVVKTPKSLSA
jgi:acyl-CoA reductase-like NAD-dependent aldehyde dehydrogenase